MVWTACQNALRMDLTEQLFSMWIRPLLAKEIGDTLYLAAPNDFFTRHINEHYLQQIKALAHEFSGGKIRQVVIGIDLPSTKEAAPQEEVAEPVVGTEQHSKPRTNLPPVKRTLNASFTFDNFVEGKSNQLAFATAKGVVDALGHPSHNPFFIYGPTGLGKTHLMHAVGNALLAQNPAARVMYMTSEQFVMNYVGALQRGNIDHFKQECRSLDLLLVDDIHLLAGKEASVNEFFHTFNTLIDESKQIILTSDRYPKELTELDARLVSRFSWGLSIAVEPPDLQTRIEILRKKAELNGIYLPLSQAQFIAHHVVANVRELEGALNRVAVTARFKGRDIDDDIVKDALKDLMVIRARNVSIDNIQKTVAEYFGIPLKEILGPKRTRLVARPRQMAMGLSRELTDQSYPEIGKAFGGRDHTTVMHACEKVEELRKVDIAFGDDYKNLLRLLQN